MAISRRAKGKNYTSSQVKSDQLDDGEPGPFLPVPGVSPIPESPSLVREEEDYTDSDSEIDIPSFVNN
jgi:hypothetical protein